MEGQNDQISRISEDFIKKMSFKKRCRGDRRALLRHHAHKNRRFSRAKIKAGKDFRSSKGLHKRIGAAKRNHADNLDILDYITGSMEFSKQQEILPQSSSSQPGTSCSSRKSTNKDNKKNETSQTRNQSEAQNQRFITGNEQDSRPTALTDQKASRSAPLDCSNEELPEAQENRREADDSLKKESPDKHSDKTPCNSIQRKEQNPKNKELRADTKQCSSQNPSQSYSAEETLQNDKDKKQTSSTELEEQMTSTATCTTRRLSENRHFTKRNLKNDSSKVDVEITKDIKPLVMEHIEPANKTLGEQQEQNASVRTQRLAEEPESLMVESNSCDNESFSRRGDAATSIDSYEVGDPLPHDDTHTHSRCEANTVFIDLDAQQEQVNSISKQDQDEDCDKYDIEPFSITSEDQKSAKSDERAKGD